MILFPMAHRRFLTLSIYACAAVFAFLSVFVVAFSAWPELSDANKPSVTFAGIREGGYYSGVVSVTFSVRDESTSVARVLVTLDAAAVYDKAIGQKAFFDGAAIDTAPLAEGEHRLVLSVIDSSLWNRLREETIVFQVDHTPPRLTVQALKDSVFQGDTEGFIITSNEPLSALQLEAFGKKIACYPLPRRANAFRGLFGVSPFTATGQAAVSCAARDRAGNETVETREIVVAHRAFPSETIELPKAKQGILTNSARIQEDHEKTEAALAAAVDTQLWRGTFSRPAPGIDSSPFGIRRVYETGGVASSHRGIDIANKEGTPITAANGGVVLLSEELFVTGNTVILDHGQGVVTYYFHMIRLAVKKGETVAKGADLGYMGTTGLSTGNHCHWELQVQRQSVNPDDWVTSSFEPEP